MLATLKTDNSQRGAALPLVLLALLFLTLLGFMAMSTSSVEVRLSANERDYQQAVYTADAGISHMRAILKDLLNVCNQHQQNDRDWDFVLRDLAADCPSLPGPFPYAVQGSLGAFQYTVVVSDNNDGQDESPPLANDISDVDGVIVLTSWATGPNNVRAGIEMLLKAEDDDNNVSGYIQKGGDSQKKGIGRDLNAVDLSKPPLEMD